MWRSNFDADWERKKKYLIRSLFDDLILSPVPEEDESFDSTRSRFRPVCCPPNTIPAPRSTHDRPYSPLPPLIIEREQNRHDEPEEYYKQLEIKVLKVYRKLFIEGKETDDTSDSGETVDRLGTSLGRRTSFGEIEVSFDEPHKSDEMSIEINEKSRKRVISEQDTDIETSDSKKSRSDSDNEVANRPKSTGTDGDEFSKLTKTQSSHSDNSINRGNINENEENDTFSDTLSSYSVNNNKRKKLEAENEVVENLSDTSLYPADNSAESEINMSNTLSSHSGIVRNTEKGNEDEVDDQVSDIMSSHPNSSNKVTGAEDSGDTPNHRDHRIVTFRADVHKEAADEGFVAPPAHQSADDTVHQTDNVSDAGSAILENYGVSDHSHFLSQTGVPEVMRSTQIHHSTGSHYQDGVSPDIEATDTAMNLEPQLEALTESDSATNVDNASRRKRSRSLSNDSIYEVGTQTSFDCYERMNRGVLRDIFVGEPKVFRLCSCVNHACAL